MLANPKQQSNRQDKSDQQSEFQKLLMKLKAEETVNLSSFPSITIDFLNDYLCKHRLETDKQNDYLCKHRLETDNCSTKSAKTTNSLDRK